MSLGLVTTGGCHNHHPRYLYVPALALHGQPEHSGDASDLGGAVAPAPNNRLTRHNRSSLSSTTPPLEPGQTTTIINVSPQNDNREPNTTGATAHWVGAHGATNNCSTNKGRSTRRSGQCDFRRGFARVLPKPQPTIHRSRTFVIPACLSNTTTQRSCKLLLTSTLWAVPAVPLISLSSCTCGKCKQDVG